jgi:purine-binding chemotaxis protein CheW
MNSMLNGTESIKLIVFSIANYQFALPIHQVLRVVNYPTIDCTLQTAGLVQLGRHFVKVLDLYPFLNVDRSTRPDKLPLFLIVLATSHGEFYGIGIDQPPDVMECTAAQIQRLPKSHTLAYGIEQISHAAIPCKTGEHSTLFLLTPQSLLHPPQSRSLPSSAIAHPVLESTPSQPLAR